MNDRQGEMSIRWYAFLVGGFGNLEKRLERRRGRGGSEEDKREGRERSALSHRQELCMHKKNGMQKDHNGKRERKGEGIERKRAIIKKKVYETYICMVGKCEKQSANLSLLNQFLKLVFSYLLFGSVIQRVKTANSAESMYYILKTQPKVLQHLTPILFSLQSISENADNFLEIFCITTLSNSGNFSLQFSKMFSNVSHLETSKFQNYEFHVPHSPLPPPTRHVKILVLITEERRSSRIGRPLNYGVVFVQAGRVPAPLQLFHVPHRRNTTGAAVAQTARRHVHRARRVLRGFLRTYGLASANREN